MKPFSSTEAVVVKKSITFEVSSKATCLVVPNRTVTAWRSPKHARGIPPENISNCSLIKINH